MPNVIPPFFGGILADKIGVVSLIVVSLTYLAN
jgi:hypothetical protein